MIFAYQVERFPGDAVSAADGCSVPFGRVPRADHRGGALGLPVRNKGQGLTEHFRLTEFMQSQSDAAQQVLQAVKDFRQTAKPIVRDACRLKKPVF